jgi:hypothetical protein
MPIWNLIAGPVLGIIGKLIPDKAAAAAAQAQLQMMVSQGAVTEELQQLTAITTAQTDVNKVEAASASIFVAGWRPYVGWVCGTGLAMEFIIGPLLTWATGHQFPKLDSPLMNSILGGMLGLGHISRTVEKIQGVAGNH